MARFALLLIVFGLSACATDASRSAATKSRTHDRLPIPYTVDAYPSTYAPLPRTDLLIRNATILDGAGRELEHAMLLVRDGKVASIGSELPLPAGIRIIDAGGRWLTPGIIDPHSHLGVGSQPETSQQALHSDLSEDSDPNGANVWAEHSINVQDPNFTRALAGGVTTLNILPGSSNLFGGRSVVLKNVPAVTVQQMKFPGAPYSLKMACGENPLHSYGDHDRFPGSRMGNFAGYREAWIKAEDYAEKWEAYERGEAKEPPARDLKLDTLAGVLRGKIRVQMHCYRADEMALVLDMAHEFGYHVAAFHHAVEAYKIASLLAKEQVCAVVWADWWGFKQEAFDAIRENAAFVDASGACATLHSDSPIVGQRMGVEVGKALQAGRRAGLTITPAHAIEWITLNPAKAMGIADQTGSLEVGKNADFVVWSGYPFSVYTRADQVYIDGALVFDRTDAAVVPRSDFEVGQPSLVSP